MNIVVCVKHTPASTSGAVDPATGQVKTEGLPFGMNPLDEYAVEEALRSKEKLPGSKVFALSLGPAGAEETLRAALALGCEEGILLTDPSFAKGDSYGTAYLLSQGIRKLAAEAPVGLIFCGKQTNDGETGSVGGQLAAWLQWPSAAFVKKIAELNENAVSVERAMEDGTDTLKLGLPGVVSVTKEINEPRLPSLKGKMAAKKAQVRKWGAADIAADAANYGANSPCGVLRTSPVPSRAGGAVIGGATPEEKAKNLFIKLKEAKFV